MVRFSAPRSAGGATDYKQKFTGAEIVDDERELPKLRLHRDRGLVSDQQRMPQQGPRRARGRSRLQTSAGTAG
jgi:hypothetical protein